MASHMFIYIFVSMFLCEGFAKKLSGKESCNGSDICYVDEYSFYDTSAPSSPNPIKMTVDLSGIYGGLDDQIYTKETGLVRSIGDSSGVKALSIRSGPTVNLLHKILGLDACCNGDFNEPPRRRGVRDSQGINYFSKILAPHGTRKRDDPYDVMERGGVNEGDPPEEWYQDPIKLGTTVLATTAALEALQTGISNLISLAMVGNLRKY